MGQWVIEKPCLMTGYLSPASAPRIPEPLVEQLRVGGTMAIPIGEKYGWQELVLVKKVKEEEVVTTNFGGVAFVPLIGEHGWNNEE